jgi:putative hydrolase of the HAD superfamily
MASLRRRRAIFFDAGNTLIRMDYGAIAAALGAHGVAARAEDVQRAEWRARVRLDAEVLAPGRASTESRATGEAYLRYLLEGLGVTDEATVAALGAWRRGYNPPAGLWTVAEPHALAALQRARAGGLATGVISNSNGSIRGIMASLGLAPHLDVVLDSAEVGVEKPDPRIFALALAAAGGLAPGEAAYVGDLYSVDVLGARAAGLEAMLIDPGAGWGPRDCVVVPHALAAVERLLACADGGPLL